MRHHMEDSRGATINRASELVYDLSFLADAMGDFATKWLDEHGNGPALRDLIPDLSPADRDRVEIAYEHMISQLQRLAE